ncbi:MAG: phosphoesterase [Phycisphaerae bacterium]|nr:phosphoesterase [Phycisphaerae bacterium]
MSEVGSEQVLVVPTELLRRLGYFQGFTGEVDRYIGTLLDSTHTSYRPRHEVETDPSYKQLIPYVLFCHEDGSGHKTLFQYTRGTKQDESRLRGGRSVGIGGHIATRDTVVNGHANAFSEGMRRELAEEVAIETPYRQRCVGLINDDDTPVGRVHLGIVYLFDVERPSVFARESEIIDGGFMSIEKMLPYLDDFEMWSRICLRALFADANG